MKQLVWVLLFVGSWSIGAAAERQPSHAVQSIKYGREWNTKTANINGIPVLAVQDHESNAFEIGLRIKTGYYSDPAKFDGLAHLVEHLIAHGPDSPYQESLGQWRGKDQARNLWFKTHGAYTDFYISCSVSDGAELASRLGSAFRQPGYTAADVKAQLDDVHGEWARVKQSSDGIIESYQGSLARSSHPYYRVSTSGGDESFGDGPTQELVAAVNRLYKSGYRGRGIAAIVVSPLATEQSLALLTDRVLASIGSSVKVRDAGPDAGAVFDNAQSGSMKEVSYTGSSDRLVLLYELHSQGSSIRTVPLELLKFVIQGSGENSLTAALKNQQAAQGVVVDAIPRYFGNSDLLRIEIVLAKSGRKNADHVYQLTRTYLGALSGMQRRSTVTEYAESVGLANLVGPQGRREPMFFDALSRIAAGESNAVFDYRESVTTSEWASAKALANEIAGKEPVHILLSAGNRADGDPSGPPVGENSLIQSISKATETDLVAIANCIRVHTDSGSRCESAFWGVEGERSPIEFSSSLQRAVAQALFEKTWQTVHREFPADVLGGDLEYFAGVTPGFSYYGSSTIRDRIIAAAWLEFLRPRTPEEIQVLQSELRSAPDNAFDASMERASELLGVLAASEARRLSIGELKDVVEDMQARFRGAPMLRFSARFATPQVKASSSKGQQADKANVEREPVVDIVNSNFGTSAYLSLKCERPTAEALAMLRLVVAPAHRMVWSAFASTGDSAMFGAYVTRRWGDELCYGLSLEAERLSPPELQASFATLAGKVDALFCSTNAQQWASTQGEALASEDAVWSREQAYILKDLRNWMRYGLTASSADVVKEAHAAQPNDVCRWIESRKPTLDDNVKQIDVLVAGKELQH